jgi:hypothetical protein
MNIDAFSEIFIQRPLDHIPVLFPIIRLQAKPNTRIRKCPARPGPSQSSS